MCEKCWKKEAKAIGVEPKEYIKYIKEAFKMLKKAGKSKEPGVFLMKHAIKEKNHLKALVLAKMNGEVNAMSSVMERAVVVNMADAMGDMLKDNMKRKHSPGGMFG